MLGNDAKEYRLVLTPEAVRVLRKALQKRIMFLGSYVSSFSNAVDLNDKAHYVKSDIFKQTEVSIQILQDIDKQIEQWYNIVHNPTKD